MIRSGQFFIEGKVLFNQGYPQNCGTDCCDIPCRMVGESDLYMWEVLLKVLDCKKIHIHVIGREEVIFSGVPAEYEQILQEAFDGSKADKR